VSAEGRVLAYNEQPTARRGMSQVCGVDGETDQGRPFPRPVRARGAGVLVQVQRESGKGGALPRGGQVCARCTRNARGGV